MDHLIIDVTSLYILCFYYKTETPCSVHHLEMSKTDNADLGKWRRGCLLENCGVSDKVASGESENDPYCPNVCPCLRIPAQLRRHTCKRHTLDRRSRNLCS